MKLYHGTSWKAWQKISTDGLTPRTVNGTSNWNHTIDSRPDCVYLTTVYAPYFALQAVDLDTEPEPAVIIEIDTDRLDRHNLLPDEDYMEQVGRMVNDGIPGDMNERTEFYRSNLNNYADYWESSITGLGTCSFKGNISTRAINRAVKWNWEQDDGFLARAAMDPAITIANYRYMKPKYEAITNFLMGYEYDEEAITGANLLKELGKQFTGFKPFDAKRPKIIYGRS